MADALLGILKLGELVIDGVVSLLGRFRGTQEPDDEAESDAERIDD